jgi:serralysin
VFNNGDSRLTWETADTILDFNRTYDWIDMPVVGTSSNFVSGTFTSSHYTSHDVMNDAYHATFSMGTLSTQYAFVTDGHNGYLFANTNGTAGFDTGVELLGLTSVNDLRYYDII